MKETKFTKGEWYVFTDVFKKSEVRGRHIGGETIAAYTSLDDANLIAVAPAMYEMLSHVNKTIKQMPVCDSYLYDISEEIQILLAKARGENV